MARYIANRILGMIVVMFLVLTATFIIVRLTPGDPAALMLGPDATTADIAQLRHTMGLDQPIPVQYLGFLLDAVHGDLGASRAVYDWVNALCVSLGADRKDLVPFDKYANAALGLASPSSAARALFGGAHNIERVDRLVQGIARQKGMRSEVVDQVVARVDKRLAANRQAR